MRGQMKINDYPDDKKTSTNKLFATRSQHTTYN